MKFPNHIILDISKKAISDSSQYWASKRSSFSINHFLHFIDFFNYKKFLNDKNIIFKNFIINNQKKFTTNYSFSVSIAFLNNNRKFYSNRIIKLHSKIKNQKNNYNVNVLKKIFKNLFSNLNKIQFVSNNLWFLFDVSFLRKEKIYTKLKYSRVPQYDIVSGGAAALFAGFLGFLICEKFGFELVDSGDFYFLLMYLVFFFFFCRLFLKIIEADNVSWNIISLKWLINFIRILITLTINFIQNKN